MNMSIFSKTYQPRKIKYARSPRLKIHHKEKEKCQQQQQQTRKVAGVEHDINLQEQSNIMEQFDCALEFTDKTSIQLSKNYEKERTLAMQGNRYSDILLSDVATNSTLTDSVGVGVINTSAGNVSDDSEVNYEELQITNPIFQSHKEKMGRSYEELQSTNPIFQSHKDKTGRRNGVSQRTELDVQMLTDMRLGIVKRNNEIVEEDGVNS